MGEVKKPWLIDANDLLALVKKNAPFIYSILAPISLLCPTIDAVPVVRCKDCVHYSRTPSSKINLGIRCCKKFDNITRETDYCSFGERRLEEYEWE